MLKFVNYILWRLDKLIPVGVVYSLMGKIHEHRLGSVMCVNDIHSLLTKKVCSIVTPLIPNRLKRWIQNNDVKYSRISIYFSTYLWWIWGQTHQFKMMSQIDFMLPCVCSVIDDRQTQLSLHVPLFLFLQHFGISHLTINYWIDAWQHGHWHNSKYGHI